MSQQLVRHRIILVILALAAVVRFWALDRADVITDEAFYAFRSIGYLDFLFAPDQPTPIELLNARPAWTHLSFHDAPPLAFVLQGAALAVFGENLWGVRIVFALAGLLAVFMVYAIASRFAGVRAGLWAAAIMAVLTPAVWVSRIGLLESVAIAGVLVAVGCFVRALEADAGDSIRRWSRWVVFGGALGLAFLVKYTTLPLVLLFVGWLMWERRLRDLKYFGAALAVAAIVFSPVIIYNLKLFETTGHFDLQFSYLFGQHPAEWQRLPGKEEFDSFADRARNFLPNLSDTFSPLGLAAFAVTVAASCVVAFRKPRVFSSPDRFFLAGLAVTTASLFVFGPSPRFLPMLSPWLAFLTGLWLARRLPDRVSWRHGVVGALLVVEFAYSVNTSIVMPPAGLAGRTFSRLAYDRFVWGYNDLEAFLDRSLAGHYPAFVFPSKYGFVNELSRDAVAAARQAGKEKHSLFIVYDASFSDKAVLWSFHRRLVYGGWPVIAADVFTEVGGVAFFRKQGIERFLFVKAEGDILRSSVSPESAEALAQELLARAVTPKVVAGTGGAARITAWEF